MDARKSAIFAFHFVKQILQAITHLKQYTILEIQFLLYDTENIENFNICPSSDACDCNG